MFIDVRFDPLEGPGGRLLAASAEGLAGAWRREPVPSAPAPVASPADFACHVVRTADGAVAYHALTLTRALHRVTTVRATFVGPRAACWLRSPIYFAWRRPITALPPCCTTATRPGSPPARPRCPRMSDPRSPRC